MKCECVHVDVCRHRSAIEATLVPIVQIGFPKNPQWDEITGFIGSVCRFRTLVVPGKEKKDGAI